MLHAIASTPQPTRSAFASGPALTPVAGGDAWIVPFEPGGPAWITASAPQIRVVDNRRRMASAER